MADKIGDPLSQVAESGTLGRKSQVPTTPKEEVPTTPARPRTAVGQEQQTRVKRTLMFTPQRAKWLKVQAAQEGREMSDIVEEALATYQQLHS